MDTPTTKEQARQQAIDWQQSQESMSYGDLVEAQEHFEKTGKEFNLLEGFKENGII